jgi:hypothetical protein
MRRVIQYLPGALALPRSGLDTESLRPLVVEAVATWRGSYAEVAKHVPSEGGARPFVFVPAAAITSRR